MRLGWPRTKLRDVTMIRPTVLHDGDIARALRAHAVDLKAQREHLGLGDGRKELGFVTSAPFAPMTHLRSSASCGRSAAVSPRAMAAYRASSRFWNPPARLACARAMLGNAPDTKADAQSAARVARRMAYLPHGGRVKPTDSPKAVADQEDAQLSSRGGSYDSGMPSLFASARTSPHCSGAVTEVLKEHLPGAR